MDRTWLKLYRKSIESQVFSDKNLWYLWSWLLMNANWKVSYYRNYEVMPGCIACTIKSISYQLDFSKTSVHNMLKKLEKWGMISVKSERNFTVISICNWGTYQDCEQGDRNTNGTRNEHEMNTDGTEDEQELDSKCTIDLSAIYKKEEVKKDRRVETHEHESFRFEWPEEIQDSESRQRLIHLAEQFCYQSTRRNHLNQKTDRARQVLPSFCELVRLGVSLDFIEKKTYCKSRSRNKPYWEWVKELEKLWKSQQPKPIEELSPAMRFLERMTGGSN